MSKKTNWKARAAKHPNPKTAGKPSSRATGAKKKKVAPKATRAKQSTRKKPLPPPTKPTVAPDPYSQTGTDGRRWYGDDERGLILAALAANGGNVNKTAREHGIPEPTLRAWASGWRCPRALQLYEDKKKDLARAAHEIAWQMAAEIPEDAATGTFREKATVFGIMVDKMLVLVGRPNNITQDLATPAPTADVSRIVEVVNTLPDHERATITRFLGLLQSGTLPATNPEDGGDALGSDRGQVGTDRPRAIPAFLT